MSKESNKKWGVVALVAALGGFVAGILTAPKSGKETREDIKVTANKAAAEVEKDLKKIHSELSVVISDTKDILKGKTKEVQKDITEKLNVAQNKQAKVKEVLSALRDGGAAENPELQKALKEAKAALDHLKKFAK